METMLTRTRVLTLTDVGEGRDDARLAYLRKTLESEFSADVEIRDCSTVHEDDVSACQLVIVASRSVPAWLDDASVPVAVLDPRALPALGMTRDAPNRDFGFTSATALQIEDSDNGDKLSMGLHGEVILSEDATQHGWGRPTSDATVVATFPSRESQAAIFAYETGAEMFGLQARHRRVAVLVNLDTPAELASEAVDLIKGCLSWPLDPAAEGISSLPATRGKKRPPITKVLSVREYEQWVHDRVTWSVLLKLSAVISAVGLVGLIAACAFVLNQVSSRLDQMPAKVIDEAKTAAEQEAKQQVAVAMVHSTEVYEEMKKAGMLLVTDEDSDVRKALTKEAKEVVLAEVNKEEFKKQLFKRAENILAVEIGDAMEGKIPGLLAGNARATATDPKVPARERSFPLSLYVMYTRDARQRGAVIRQAVAGDAAKPCLEADADLQSVGFRLYDPSAADPSDNAAMVTSVLSYLSSEPKMGLHLPDSDYVGFLERFPSDDAVTTLDWVATKGGSCRDRHIVFAAISKILVRQKSEDIVDRLVKLLGSDVAPDVWITLSEFQGQLSIADLSIPDETHRELLTDVWTALAAEVKRPATTPRSELPRVTRRSQAYDLFRAAISQDIAKIRELRRQAFLLPACGLHVLYRDILSDPSRLQFFASTFKEPEEILRRTATNDWRDDPRVGALSWFLRSEDDEVVRGWLERNLSATKEERLAQEALIVAWKRSLVGEAKPGVATATGAREGTIDSVGRVVLEHPDWLEREDLRDVVGFCIRSGKPSFAREFFTALPAEFDRQTLGPGTVPYSLVEMVDDALRRDAEDGGRGRQSLVRKMQLTLEQSDEEDLDLVVFLLPQLRPYAQTADVFELLAERVQTVTPPSEERDVQLALKALDALRGPSEWQVQEYSVKPLSPSQRRTATVAALDFLRDLPGSGEKVAGQQATENQNDLIVASTIRLLRSYTDDSVIRAGDPTLVKNRLEQADSIADLVWQRFHERKDSVPLQLRKWLAEYCGKASTARRAGLGRDEILSRLARAEHVLDDLIQSSPDDLDLYDRRGRVHLEAQAWSSAVADLTKAMEKLPADGSRPGRITEDDLRTLRAVAYAESGELDAAIADLDWVLDAIEKKSDGMSLRDRASNSLWRGGLHRRSGNEAAAKHNFREAVATCKRLIESGDNPVFDWNNLGLAQIALAERKDSLESIGAEKAIDQSIRFAYFDRAKGASHENLGLLYLRLRDYQQSLNLTDRILKYDGGDQLSWNWLVRAIAAKRLATQAKEGTKEREDNLEKANIAWGKWEKLAEYDTLYRLKTWIADEIDWYLGNMDSG